MSPFEIRLELLKLAKDILQARYDKPEQMPTSVEVISAAQILNDFVSNHKT
jgi:hypothetical protein